MLMTMLSLLPFLLLVYVIANFTNKIISVVKDAFVGLKKIKLYEKNNNCKVIYLLDKDKKIKYFDIENFLIGTNVSIDVDDSETFRDILEQCMNENKDVSLVIDCSGGSVVDSDYIVKHIDVFRSKGRKVTAIVPRKAYSAACLIAFACDEIKMGQLSALTPTDPISYDDDDNPCSIAALKRAFEDLDKVSQPTADELAQHYDDLKLYDETKKSMKIYIKRQMKTKAKSNKKNLNNVVNAFTSGKLSHHTLFSVRDLTGMGIRINKIDESCGDHTLTNYYNVIYRMIELSY